MNNNPFLGGLHSWLSQFFISALLKGGTIVVPALLLAVLPPHLIISERGTYCTTVGGNVCVRGEPLTL